jgi:hypothetical protein
MDEAPADVQAKAQKPQNSQNHENRPKHVYSPLAKFSSVLSVQTFSSRFKRLAALQTAGSVTRCDEPAKWAHTLRGEIAVVRCNAYQLSQ